MKIVVVGGSGVLGSKLVAALGADGHEVVAASRRSGVDAVTGEGLTEALVHRAAQYEDKYRLCFLRGPEGIIIALAEQLS